jgi:hypothetical protein
VTAEGVSNPYHDEAKISRQAGGLAKENVEKQFGAPLHQNVKQAMNTHFPGHALAEIFFQRILIRCQVCAQFGKEPGSPWPPRTFGNVRIAFFPGS